MLFGRFLRDFLLTKEYVSTGGGKRSMTANVTQIVGHPKENAHRFYAHHSDKAFVNSISTMTQYALELTNNQCRIHRKDALTEAVSFLE